MFKLTYQQLYDFILNAWKGKCISGNIGFHLECYKEIFDFQRIEDFAPKTMYPNDDLDIQIAWLDILMEKGAFITSDDLIQKFIDSYHFDFSEYGYAKRNFKRGIHPPYSGSYNNYFADGMGCPIRSEIWALAALNNPDLAAKFAYQDGVIDHAGEAVYAEMFFAAAESMTLTDKNPVSIFTKALKYLPQASLSYQAVQYALNSFTENREWRQAIQYLHDTFGSADGTYCVINVGITVLGVLYGGKDYDKVMTFTLNGGYDTDCTCATAGALYAMLYGIEGIEKKWLEIAGENIVTAAKNLKRRFDTFDQLTKGTAEVTATFAASALNDKLSILDSAPVLPIAQNLAPVEIEASYPQGCEINPLRPLQVQLTVTVRDDNIDEAKITFESNRLSVSPTQIALKKGACQHKLNITLTQTDTRMIFDQNIITANFKASNAAYTYTFGVAGSQCFRLSRVFSDGFDFDAKGDIDKLPQELVRVYGGKKMLFHMDCNEYTNNWVRSEHPYIDENFSQEHFEKCFTQGKTYYTQCDFIRLKDVFTQKGPMAVYAFQKLMMTSERQVEFHIGSSDPYKLWVNGELLAMQKDNWYFSPYNQRPRVTLKKGENQIVVKLIRKGEDQKFAYVLREEPFNHVGPIATDISNGIE